MLADGGRWRGQILSPAPSLLNYQLDFISPEDNNSHSAQRMSSVLLFVLRARRWCDTDAAGRNEQLMLGTSSVTLWDILRGRQKLHKPNKPDGLLDGSMGCILHVHLGRTRKKSSGCGRLPRHRELDVDRVNAAAWFLLVPIVSQFHIVTILA